MPDVLLDANAALRLRDGPDLYCSCGYNLRGLPAACACPECGSPPAPPVGQCLWHADVHWLRKLRIGIVLMLGHWFAFAPATVAFVPLANGHHPCMDLVWLFPQAVLLAGVWMLTSPEPGLRSHRRDLRRALLTRRLSLVWLGLTTLRALLEGLYRYRGVFPRFDSNTARLDLSIAICCALWTALVALHLATLGRRVNSGWLSFGGGVVWTLIAWGVVGEAIFQLYYAADHDYWSWPASEIRDSAGFAFLIASVFTIGFLTAYWIVVNLAIDGTTLQLKRANDRRQVRASQAAPSPHPPRITRDAWSHLAECSTANSA